MRVGQNPAKYVKEVAKPERVTVALINYIPFVSGFYAEMPEVLKTCLESLWENTTEIPYDLVIFDNGSCDEVREYLITEFEAGRIQQLILSEKNLGKGGAWNILLGGAPGEIIAYSDNDCLYKKGWLSRSLEILDTYPNVGMVTSRPFRTPEEFVTKTIEWAEKETDVNIKHGQLIPWEVFLEFDRSLAQTEDDIRRHYETTQDVLLHYKGVDAIVGASHWQFVSFKDVICRFLPFNMERPMGQVRQLDKRMNEDGFLRLMPTDPLVMNMSNTLRNLPGKVTKIPVHKKFKLFQAILDFPLFKRPILALYDQIFRWYYDRD